MIERHVVKDTEKTVRVKMDNIIQRFKRIAVGGFVQRIRKSNNILISDTTLRDGEQAPGAGLGPDQKLAIARQLKKLGVDAIEAGFPASSEEEARAVELIGREVRGPVISALCRCVREDIETAVNSLKHASRWGLALFIGTSPILRKHSLHDKSQDEIISLVRDSIKFAKKYTDSIAFGAEDAVRTEPEFLYRVYEEAIESGAVVIGFPDTVGWLVPGETAFRIQEIKKNVRNIENALLAVHFHNDLGLATANTLTAVQNGANIVQCTINGLGERAGNTSLEEFVMALKIRKDYYKGKVGINTKELFATSQLVEKFTGVNVCAYKSVVGKNVFATEAGIHQAALLEERATYEIIRPEDVGQSGTTFVLGRHSGKNIIIYKLRQFGYKLDEKNDKEIIEDIYRKFKALAVTKKSIEETELADIARAVIK